MTERNQTPVVPSRPDRGRRAALGGVILCSIGLAGLVTFTMNERPQAFQRLPGRIMAPPHTRPIIERGGKRLLWARGLPNSPKAEWFDVSDALIDPKSFQFGIGKDRIPSIDQPAFADADDTRLAEAGIDDSTVVFGYAERGEAKAYPVHILDRHELVNDSFGGRPVTVGW